MWGCSWTPVMLASKISGPAWPAPQHTQSSCSGDLEGISKGWAAVTKGALEVKCCIIDGLSCTVPKIFFKTPYFCVFVMNLEPPGSVPTPCKCCITMGMG